MIMSGVQSVTGGMNVSAMRGPGGPGRGPLPEVLDAVAEKLGISSNELRAALENGSTLARVAEANGTSREELLAAIVDGLEHAEENGLVPPPGAPTLESIAGMMADGKRPDPPAGRVGAMPMGPPPVSARGFDELASVLGMEPSDLVEQLDGGARLSEIARTQQVDVAALLDVFAKGLRHDDRL